MKAFYKIFILLFPILVFGQQSNIEKTALVFTPEFLRGKTMESNDDFPQTRFQSQISLGIGRYHNNSSQEWASRLKAPKTGVNFIFTDFGNLDSLGVALTALPIIEFNIFGSKRMKLLTGLGASYFTKKFHPEQNPNNRAVTTSITWAFKMNLYYEFLKTENLDWRIGLSYSHHSNGHTRLMNQGYNSFLLSLSADVKNLFDQSIDKPKPDRINFNKSTYSYFALRGGSGQNVFAEAFNDRKNVYTIAGEYGQVYNKTFKLGIGFYYRFYEHYHDYIRNDESLVKAGREFDYFKSNPWYYASNLAITVHGEILMNHVGIDLQVGFDFYKPAYRMEWRINEGWDKAPREIPRGWSLGEYDSYFRLKHKISARIGVKYYWYATDKLPKNNFYIGGHLNSNLGQADFTELSLGYVYSFNRL